MRYFAYGSNTNVEQMKARCPDAVAIGVATLSGYCLEMSGVAGIEADKKSSVIGVLWDISNSDVMSLDRFEGVPYSYCRKEITVECNGDMIKCMTYETVYSATHTYRPCESYYLKIKDGYEYFGIPVSQLDAACDFGGKQPYSPRKSRRIRKYHPDMFAVIDALNAENERKNKEYRHRNNKKSWSGSASKYVPWWEFAEASSPNGYKFNR